MSFGVRPTVESDQPGTYPVSATAVWDYYGNVDKVVLTINDIAPAISEYIAYDNANPPNPFIAVTQDGKGNVAYDGGFPKIYNQNAPAVGTIYEQLSSTFKYFCNVLNFIANKEKTDNGNRNILILGDRVGNEYSIKGTNIADFHTTLERLAFAGNWTFTYKDTSDYAGGLLNTDFIELENYVAVVLVSSNYVGSRITNNCVTDLVEFRKQGNGLFLISDDGPFLNTLEAATLNDTGFFATANKVAVNFGAWFSGLYNRTPVNVGYIRNNYGDHPLYNGLSNSDSIAAGPSESRIFVNEDIVPMNPEDYQSTTFTEEGINTINFLIISDTGEMAIFNYTYVIGNTIVIIEFTDYEGNPIRGNIDLGIDNKITVDVKVYGGQTSGTLMGDILLNEVKIGELFWSDSEGSKTVWYDGSNINLKINNGDVLKGTLTQPFTFDETIDFTRIQPRINDDIDQATIINKLREFLPNSNPHERIQQVFQLLGNRLDNPYSNKLADNINTIKAYLR